MTRMKVYSTGICPICDNSKNLLKKWNIPFEEARVDRDQGLLREMLQVTDGARRVPQFAIDGKWIGGFSELTMLHMEGKLDHLTAEAEISTPG